MRKDFLRTVTAVVVLCSLSVQVNAQTRQTIKTEVTTTASSKKFSANLDPIWLLVSGIGGRFDYFLTDRAALEVGGMYIPNHRKEKPSSDKDESKSNLNNYNWEQSEVWVGSQFMLSGDLASNGMYAAPAIGYLNSRISEFSQYNLSGSLSTTFVKATVGYQWVNHTNFGSDLKVAVGGGLKVAQANDIVVKDSSGKELAREKAGFAGLAIDAIIGLVF